jgi:hypothetical protein
MALDIFCSAGYSDALERVFSTAGNVLSPRRRLLQGETLGWLMTLKSLINGNVIAPNESLFDRLSSTVSVKRDHVSET